MATSADVRAPAHLWIVGILALLWNAYGCYDYFMTEMKSQAYLAQLPADALAYWNGLPAWLTAFWALGVWGGLVGSLLLLLRNRHAVWAFALSAIGAIVAMGYQMFVDPMPASLSAGAMRFMPWVIIIFAVALFLYSRTEDKNGVLR